MPDIRTLIYRKRCEGRIKTPKSYRLIAKESGISASTICRTVNGGKPDIETLKLLGKWLDVPIGELVDGLHSNKDR
jgi:transcriptional regulator with XRE-family HTH domain